MTRVASDVWLSEVMRRDVYRVEADGVAVDAVVAHAGARADAFYFAKVPSERVTIVRALEGAGFHVVDVNVTFAMAAPFRSLARARRDSSAADVGECRAEEAAAVLDVAGSCFRYTRFHLDPRVEDSLAHRIKREWVRNYVSKKRGDRLFVARLDGRPAGFLAALVGDRGGERTAVIDLVGVATDLQGRGIGRALVDAFIDHYRDRASRLAVGTQVANVPSARLYEACGFSFHASEYVLHKHVPDERP